MSEDHDHPVFAVSVSFLTIALLATIAVAAWLDNQRQYLRAEAVSRGYAEWKVDPKTGETTWGWITPARSATPGTSSAPDESGTRGAP